MAVDHDHIWDVFGWAKANFAWLSGTAVAMFYAVRWSIKSAMKNLHLPHHVTHEELRDCQNKVLVKLSNHEREEFQRFDMHSEANKQMMKEYREENMRAHERINKKMDDLTHTIIKHLDK